MEAPEESSWDSKTRKTPTADEWLWSTQPLGALASACSPVIREMPQGQISKDCGTLLKLRAYASWSDSHDTAQRATVTPME